MGATESKVTESGQRNFLKAWERISDLKLPPNPDLLARICQGLEEDSYEENAILLVTDIKQDVALFCGCVRRAVETAKSLEIPILEQTDPVALLHWVGYRVLKAIVELVAEELEDQKFDDLSEQQASCLQGTVAALAAAEVLAEAQKIDPDIAYSAGLLRQLPLLLLVWKYPTVYANAVSSACKQGKPLFETLSTQLKFPLSLISTAIGRQWNVPPALKITIHDPASSSFNYSPAEIIESDELRKIARIGEQLARANDPLCHVNAAQDWRDGRDAIDEIGGPDLLRRIYDRIRTYCSPYVDYAPLLFQHNLETSIELQLGIISSGTLLQRNRYIRECPVEVRERLEELYSRLDAKFIFREDIRELLLKVVPLAGFNRGCIYSFNPVISKLMPQMSLGSAQLSNFQNVDCSPLSSEKHPVSEAYLMGGQVTSVNEWGVLPAVCVSGVLGTIQKAGVLYLQASAELTIMPEERIVMLYRALNRTLMDILKLY